MTVTIHVGDALEVLRGMADESVHCCVTSPPYWGLRSYGGDPGMIGLEPTLDEHLANLVAVFREVRRVLRGDGTLWLNYGDAYAAAPRGNRYPGGGNLTNSNIGSEVEEERWRAARNRPCPEGWKSAGMKPKDLMGLPWRVAFALQDDGWWLRRDIVWHKANPMPESCKDRPTSAHEFIFLMAKSERYHYDNEAVKEPVAGTAKPRRALSPAGWDTSTGEGGHGNIHRHGQRRGNPAGKRAPGVPPKSVEPGCGIKANDSMQAAVVDLVTTRNLRDVWTFGSEAFPGAHFATFPTALVEPCIKAGCPQGGTCLDPFAGAGTVGLVAQRLGRDAVLIEINADYARMAEQRIVDDAPLLADVSVG